MRMSNPVLLRFLKLKYDLILSKPWIKKTSVQYYPKPKRLRI